MFNFQVYIVIFLYGFTHVRSFFHFTHDLLPIENSDLSDNVGSEILWFEAPLDNFNKSDQRTIKISYCKNMDSWKPGGPIVILLNGMYAIYEPYCRNLPLGDDEHSLIKDLVQETDAAFFIFEHRYYGNSKPVPKPTVDDLAFLSSRQALADAALFLQTMKATPEFNNSKVMMLGGNYAGSLATWMKVLYPHLVDAVLASSAPLLAKIDFYEFYESITESLSTYGTQACVDKINKKFNRIKKCMETPEGIKEIMKEYDICEEDMSRPENQQIFILQLTMEYIQITEHGSPKQIHNYCKKLSINSTQTKNLFPFIRNDKLGCWMMNYDFVVPVAFMFNHALYLWLYQSCTEFGWFLNTSSNKQIFGNNSLPVDFFYFSCKYVFGKEFTEERVKQGVIDTNKRYGGVAPNVKNVVFTNGDLDPWNKVSVLHDLSADAPAILIKGSAKSRDLFIPSDDDGEYNTENLKKAKKRVKSLLKQWIGAA